MKTIHNKQEYKEYLYILDDYFNHCSSDQELFDYERFKWNIYNAEDAKDTEIRKFFDNRILDKMIECYHSPVRDVVDRKIYNFLGIQITDEDYYWILEESNGHVTYLTCVNDIEKI